VPRGPDSVTGSKKYGIDSGGAHSVDDPLLVGDRGRTVVLPGR
jgi:hypothetical protein